MQLIQYRDSGLHTYTYFWIDDDRRVMSPYFDASSEAYEWLDSIKKDLTEEDKDS